MRSNFRFQRIRALLTYACPVAADENPIATAQELCDFLKAVPAMDAVVVGQEKHENGKRHFHAYVRFTHKVHVRDPRFLDFKGVHPNISGDGSESNMIKYVTKEGNYVSHNFDVASLLGPKSGKTKKDDIYAQALEMAKAGRLAEAKALVCDKDPMGYMARHEQIDSGLEKVYARHRAMAAAAPVQTQWTTDVQHVDLNATIRVKNADGVEVGAPYVPCHILVGDAGIGKTELARYLLQRAGCQNVAVISNIEDLKTAGGIDGFVFDEAAFNVQVKVGDSTEPVVPIEQQILLLDTQYDRSIKARFRNVLLGAHVRRVYTTNLLSRAFCYHNPAIARRAIVHNLGSEPLFV